MKYNRIPGPLSVTCLLLCSSAVYAGTQVPEMNIGGVAFALGLTVTLVALIKDRSNK